MMYQLTKGFTLIETLVAIAILTLAVAGPLVTASRAIVATETSRDHLIASYLAQEGIEYVRVLRDNTYLTAYEAGGDDVSATAWNDFVTGIEQFCDGDAGDSCTLDPDKPMGYGGGQAINTYNGDAPLYVYNGRYTQQNSLGSTKTPFTRTIQVFQASGSDEKIVSTVSWMFHSTPYSVSVSEHLTPWQ